MRSRRESRRSSGKMTASSQRAAWEGETATSWPALSSGPASRLSQAAAGSGREAIFWLPLRGTNTFSLCQEGRDQPCWPCISSCFPACAGPWAGRLSCLRPRKLFSGSSRHTGPAASPRGISVSREAGPSFIRGASGTLNSRGSAPYSPSGETGPSWRAAAQAAWAGTRPASSWGRTPFLPAPCAQCAPCAPKPSFP